MRSYELEHVGIASDDPEVLAAWYSEVLGFREFFRSEAVPPAIFLEDPKGSALEIFPRKSGEERPGGPQKPSLHLAIRVDEYDSSVADLEGKGVRFSTDTFGIFAEGKARFFSDPEGNPIHIVYRPRSPWPGRYHDS